jgi:hypothetical protein
LLDNENVTPELLGKILASLDFADILKGLGEHPELLDNEKLTRELLDKILDSVVKLS